MGEEGRRLAEREGEEGFGSFAVWSIAGGAAVVCTVWSVIGCAAVVCTVRGVLQVALLSSVPYVVCYRWRCCRLCRPPVSG